MLELYISLRPIAILFARRVPVVVAAPHLDFVKELAEHLVVELCFNFESFNRLIL